MDAVEFAKKILSVIDAASDHEIRNGELLVHVTALCQEIVDDAYTPVLNAKIEGEPA